MELGNKEERSKRAKARNDWPILAFKLGAEPSENLSKSTTAEERIAMMWPLAESAWLLANGEIPFYFRSEMPGWIGRRTSRSTS